MGQDNHVHQQQFSDTSCVLCLLLVDSSLAHNVETASAIVLSTA